MKKLVVIFTLAIVIAGVFIPFNAFAETPWNVDVMLKCNGKQYSYNLYENINGLGDLSVENRGVYLSARGKKEIFDRLVDDGFTPRQAMCYVLYGMDKVLDKLENDACCSPVDATVKFGRNGFVYTQERQGISVDVVSLFNQMLSKKTVDVPLVKSRCVTVSELKSVTQKLSEFTTTFANSSRDRAYNIALATKSIDGIVVKSGEKFSFNETVGRRSEERGYRNAKVILNGKYVDGVGGGVCQVSTTLYNALLLAGVTISESHSHTLVPSYVRAGFDAMVAYGTSDLTFVNSSEFDLYISGKTTDKSVTFTVYGKPTGYTYKRVSVETSRTPFDTLYVSDVNKYPELVYEDQQKVITNGIDGLKCNSYIETYLDGKLIDTRLLRKNTYSKVDKVVARGTLPTEREQEESS